MPNANLALMLNLSLLIVSCSSASPPVGEHRKRQSAGGRDLGGNEEEDEGRQAERPRAVW